MKTENKVYGRIYLLLNLVNGKCYIGQTVMPIKKRFYYHVRESKNKLTTMAISRAINKYGKENFIYKELCLSYSKNELNLMESKHIFEYSSMIPNGYNIREIDKDGCCKHSLKTIEKLKKIRNTPEYKKILSKNGKKTRGKSKGGFSKYCGLKKDGKNWNSRICVNNKMIYIGSYKSEIDAAKAYDIAAIKYFGHDCNLNFPELRKSYINNEIVIKTNKELNLCSSNKKSKSNILGVSLHIPTNKWRVKLSGFKIIYFLEQIDAENYALECLKIRNSKFQKDNTDL